MNNVKSKVALVRCFSYQQEEVEQALAKGLALLGGFSTIFLQRPRLREASMLQSLRQREAAMLQIVP